MKKLHLKTRLITLVKKFPHFIALAIVLISAAVAIFIYLPSHKSSASGGYDFVRQIPSTSYSIQAPEAIASDAVGNIYVYRRSPNSGVVKIGNDGQYIGQIIGADQLPYEAYGLAVDSSGNIYATQNDGFIKKFNSSGEPTDTIQLDGSNDGNYNDISGIAIDSQDRIYATDYYRKKVQVFDSEGNFLFKWGSYGSGDGQFVGLRGIAIDSQDYVYIVDSNNRRVQKFDGTGTYLSKWGGYGSGNGQFNQPSSVFIDSYNNVYVTDDYNYRIQKFSNEGVYQAQWGGYSSVPEEGKFGGMLEGTSGYSRIWGAANASGLYITDYYGYRVQKFDTDGQYLGEFGEYAPSQMKGPASVALDGSGCLYVVDAKNYRIQKFDQNGDYLTQWGTKGSGEGEFSGNGNSILASLAIDKQNGFVYVVDEGNLRIQKFDLNGTFLDEWGSSGSANGQFKWNEISSGIGGVAVGTNGEVYVSDHERVQRFDSSGNHIQSFTTEAGVFALASDASGNIYARTGSSIYKYNSSGALQKTINWSLSNYNTLFNGIAVDQYGDIYVSGNYSVQKLNSSGDYISEWGGEGTGSGQFTKPSGIALTGDGKIYVSDQGGWPTGRESQRVQLFQDNTQLSIDTTSLPGGAVGSSYSESISTSGSHGVVTFSISSGSLPAGLSINSSTGEISGTPSAAATRTFTVMAQDSLYTATKQFTVSVPMAAVLPEVTTTNPSGVGSSQAGIHGFTSPKGVTQRGFEYGPSSSYGYSVTDSRSSAYSLSTQWGEQGSGNGQFADITDIATDRSGNVYVSEGYNNRIQKFNSKGDFLFKLGSAYSSNIGEFKYPMSIATDSDNNMYVAELYNDRIQKFSSAGSYIDQYNSLSHPVDYPTSMVIDSKNDIYVAENQQSLVNKFNSDLDYIASWGSSGGGLGQFTQWKQKLSVDSGDNIYALDTFYGRVQKFEPDGSNPSQWTSVELAYPGAIAIDSKDEVFILDQTSPSSKVLVFDANGSYLNYHFDIPFNGQPDIIIDKRDNVYISNNNTVYKYANSIEETVTNLSCGTTYHYRAFATNSAGTSYGEDKTFTTADCPLVDISITTTTLPDSQVAEAYSSAIHTQDGQGVKAFSVIDGALPNGLSLDNSSGAITGTPTQAGDYTFTVNVTDDFSADSAILQIHVAPLTNSLSIITNSLADGEVGTIYTQDVDVSDPNGSVTFTITDGFLPTGLAIASDTGVISGNPTTAGDYTFTITAADTYSTDSRQYTVTIMPGPDTNGDSVSISTLTLPDGKVGVVYAQPIEVTTPTGNVTYTLSGGELPDGLTINSDTGVISGTPSDAGVFDFTVTAADDNDSDSQALQIEVKPADSAMYIITKSLADGKVGSAYDQDILVKKASGKVTYTVVAGSLPSGLIMSNSGTISGKPTKAKTYTFTIRVADSTGRDSQEYSITVKPVGAVVNTKDPATSQASTATKDEVIAKELEEISQNNEMLARPIGVIARQFNITPSQVVLGLPWLVMALFGLFTALMASRSYTQVVAYKAAKRRQEFHKQLIEEKSTFVALASHYLRTPITVIKGGIELMGSTVSGAVSGLQAAGSRLTKAVNDVIEKIENGGKGG